MSWRHPLQKIFALELQRMANRAVRNEMSREFQRTLSAFDILEQGAHNQQSDRRAAALPEKEKDTDKKDVSVASERRDPYYAFDYFDESFEDFFRDRSPFGRLDRALSSFDSFDARFSTLQNLADQIRQDMDKQFKQSTESFEGKEGYPTLADPENTTYFKRVETNDNGHVRIKTISKKPGSEWETNIEEYQGEQPVCKIQTEGKQAIEGKESKEAPQKQTLETKKESKKENVGQTSGSKSSGSGSTSASP
jgi:hypothetical protein